MARISLITLLFIIVFLVGWKGTVHVSAVDLIYYSMPPSLKEKINLSLMESASIVPDRVYKDFASHKYPYSYNKTRLLLVQARKSYKNSDFNNASYSFGLASHYMLDSFDAPHYVVNETSRLHNEFESVPLNAFVDCKDYNLTLSSMNYKESGKKDWASWIETKNSNIQEKELEAAMQLLYSSSIETFDFECSRDSTTIEETGIIHPNKETILAFAFILVLALRFF